MKLQVLLKELVREKMTTEQFISTLESKGIDVLFNQASTGFVSGISYRYEGMIFKGAHLGNAYKWQAIKNSISYEQERDRAAIHQANLRTRAGQSERATTGTGTTGSAGYGAIENAAEGDTAALQQGAGQLQEHIRTAHRNDDRKVQQDRQTAINLFLQLGKMADKAEQLNKLQNRILGRWIIRLYLICILVECCSALMTLLIVWMNMR